MSAIGRDTVVAIDLELADFQGNLIQRSERSIRYLHGGYGEVLPALERALEGKAVGARVTARLEPEEAFGDYDAELVLLMPLEELGEGVEVGMRVEGDDGEGASGRIFTITDIADGMAVLDGNHPLAGFALRFDITVLDVRAASPEELATAESTRLPEFLRLAEARPTTLH